MKRLQGAQIGYQVMSCIFYLAAFLYLTVSEIPPNICCIASGLLFILYGAIKILGYFSDDLYNLAFQHDLACGLFLIIMGSLILICSQRIIQLLSTGLGVLILLDSLLKIQTAVEALKFGLSTWKRLFIIAVITGMVSTLVIAKPFQSDRLTHLIQGSALFLEGLMNQFVLHYTLKNKKETSKN